MSRRYAAAMPKPKRAEGRRKGAAGERELAAVLAEHGWPARRGQQRSGLDTADVIDGPPGWHFESKRTEKLQLRKAVAQACRDAPAGEVPVVAHRWNNGTWLAILPLNDLLRLIGNGPSMPAVPGSALLATLDNPPVRKRAPRGAKAVSGEPLSNLATVDRVAESRALTRDIRAKARAAELDKAIAELVG